MAIALYFFLSVAICAFFAGKHGLSAHLAVVMRVKRGPNSLRHMAPSVTRAVKRLPAVDTLHPLGNRGAEQSVTKRTIRREEVHTDGQSSGPKGR